MSDEEKREVVEAITSGRAVVHYERCWPCQVYPRQCYDPPQVHTWMDRDDAEHAGVAWPVDPSEPGRLCGCECAVPSGRSHAEQAAGGHVCGCRTCRSKRGEYLP